MIIHIFIDSVISFFLQRIARIVRIQMKFSLQQKNPSTLQQFFTTNRSAFAVDRANESWLRYKKDRDTGSNSDGLKSLVFI